MGKWKVILEAALLISLRLGARAAGEKSSSPASSYPYDISTELTVSGTVQEITDYQCPVTGTVGSHITLITESGTIEVHLAPAKFLKEYEIVIRKGDVVKLVAAKIVYQGKPALLAKTITIDRQKYAFRGDNGSPLW